jgi:hypothetical protein
MPPRRRRNNRRSACPQDDAIKSAVARLTGQEPTSSCELVNPKQMGKALRSHDWPSDTDPNEFYGFHTDDGRILVQRTAPWSVLHERLHDGGIDDKHVARWLCEALTEEAAEHLHKTEGFAWRPTYPEQRRVVQREVLPRLNMTGVELAQLVAEGGRGDRRPDRVIAAGVARDPKLRGRHRAILRAVGKGSDEAHAFLEAIR